MFCMNCGAVLSEDAAFCKECGCKVEVGAQPQEQPQEQRQEEPSTPEKGEKKSKEKSAGKRQGSAGRTFLSVLLSILVVLLMASASVIFLFRHMVSEDVIDSAVKSLKISEAKLCFVEKSPTIMELVRDNAEPEFRVFLTDERLEKLLDEKFVRKFVSEKINDYVEDILHNTGNGIIEGKEIEKLLEQNRDIIYENTLFLIEDGEGRQMVSRLEDLLEQTDLSVYRDENPLIFQLIRCFSSYWMAALFLLLAVLLLAGIIALQKKKARGLIYLGVDLILVGVINLAAAGMTNSLGSLLNRTIGLGRNFWRTLLNPVKDMGIKQGAILVAVGAVLSLVFILLNIISKKKNRAGVKMHA